MNKNSIFGGLLFLVLVLVSTQVKSAILYQVDNRFTDHSLTFAGTVTPDAPFADFTNSNWAYEAGAYQSSQLRADSMSGVGSTYAGADAMGYGADATSVFDVIFTVDQNSAFTLNGHLNVSGWSDVSVELLENGSSLFSMDSFSVDQWYEPDPFSFAGTLLEGNTYQLVLSSFTFESDYWSEEWSFDLQASPVPLPAAAWLFIAGIVSLLGFARRPKSS